ncbi:MAG: molybdate ABC transporter substrate-binding protein [Actinomycetota bacterium]|nr:molybdate ABC transporter substrate-binding protein [Actinomycetota bacterium]
MKRCIAAFSLLLAACGGSSKTEVVVFAAASLTEPFQAIGTAFERTHPEIGIRFNFGPSDGLATQINDGAPAAVFASASERWMDAVAGKRGVRQREVFARNRLAIIVPASNPAHIASLSDVARTGVKVVVAARGVPAGDYARQVFAKAGISAEANIVSNEESVKGVVQKILLAEADAGIAYETDVSAAVSQRVRLIHIPDAENIAASYPIALVGSHASRSAADFIEYVMGEGQTVLRSLGFLPPS